MLTLNILQLIKNKTIPINYKITPINNYIKYKYIYNDFNIHIIETLNFLQSLSIAYLYIYTYISLKQKLLFSTNSMQHMYMLKSIAALTSNYCISNNTMYSGMFSNWSLLKKKLIIYKWLRYFFVTNLVVKNKYKNTIYIHRTLYFLYIKLKLRYHGLKNLNSIPDTLLFINIGNNKFLEEAIKLNKNIILITNNELNKFSAVNMIKIISTTKNFVIIHFILKIITTAILHGIINIH